MTSAIETLSVTGQTMAVMRFNEDKNSTPIICLHGITSSPPFWTLGMAPLVQEKYRWYSMSLPGHYPAAFPANMPPEALTADSLTATVAEATRQLVGEQPVLFYGHSTGGFLALAMAAKYPQQVAGVISVGGFARGQWRGILGRLQKWARGGALGQTLFRSSLQLTNSTRGMYGTAVNLYAADRQALQAFPHLKATLDLMYPYAQKLDPQAMQAYFSRMPDIDISAWLPQITAPVLVLTGDQDGIVHTTQARLIADTVPNAQLVMIPGAGHLPMCERAPFYNKTVTHWIEQHFPIAS